MFGYNKPQLMAIVFCHKERGISVEEENHLVTVGIVKKSKTILVLLASPNRRFTPHKWLLMVGDETPGSFIIELL